jgi:hypothetical protein
MSMTSHRQRMCAPRGELLCCDAQKQLQTVRRSRRSTTQWLVPCARMRLCVACGNPCHTAACLSPWPPMHIAGRRLDTHGVGSVYDLIMTHPPPSPQARAPVQLGISLLPVPGAFCVFISRSRCQLATPVCRRSTGYQHQKQHSSCLQTPPTTTQPHTDSCEHKWMYQGRQI